MKRLAMTLLSLLVFASSAAADTGAVCGVATIKDVVVVTETVPQSTITVHDKDKKPGDQRSSFTTPTARQSKKYLVTIRLNDIVYTVESPANAPWNFNPTRYVINDSVSVCVIKDRVTMKRPDGKDYKTKIVRAAREMGR